MQIGCVAQPARLAGCERLPGLKKRFFQSLWFGGLCFRLCLLDWKFRVYLRVWFAMWHARRRLRNVVQACMSPFRSSYRDPLSGGGSAATARKRKEHSQIAQLSAALADLTQQVQQLKASRGRPTKPRKRPKVKPQVAQAHVSASAPPGPPLYSQLKRLFLEWKGPEPPSDNQLRTALLALLTKGPEVPRTSGKDPPKQNAPAVSSSVKPQDSSKTSWASVVSSASRVLKPHADSPQSLYGPAWKVPIIKASATEQHSFADKCVIACVSHEEYKHVKEWLQATGVQTPLTIVTLSKDGKDTVQVHGPAGSVPHKADIETVGADAPLPIKLPTQFKDDAPAAPSTGPSDTILCRLTLAKEFCRDSLFREATANPQFLPAMLLRDLRKMVLQTRGALAYNTEVTCLIRVSQRNLATLLQAQLPTGAFLSKHGTTSIPQWIPREKGQNAASYYTKAHTLAFPSNARVIYRPSSFACLGIISDKSAAGTVPPRWFLTGAPPIWGEDELAQWAKDRGFLDVGAVRRHGRRTWFFRAHPPEGVDLSQCAYSFASGVSVSMAKSQNNQKHSSPKAAPRTTWGARCPKHHPTEPNSQDESAEPATTVMDVDAEESQGGPSAASAAGEDRKHARNPNPNSPDKTTKRPKTDVLEDKPPYEEHFQTFENEGKGDCAFIAIAQAMSINSGGFSKASKNDFLPKGRLQAQLRLLCSRELAKAPEGTYTATAAESTSLSNQVLQAGFWADSVSLASLAEAIHHEFRIWAWCSKDKRWKFYVVSTKASKKQSPGIVWLKLHKEHYECLVPKELPQGTVERWLKAACYAPASLKGAGRSSPAKSSSGDPDALSILGLLASVTASPSCASTPKRQRSAMSILGLTPATSSRVASPSAASNAANTPAFKGSASKGSKGSRDLSASLLLGLAPSPSPSCRVASPKGAPRTTSRKPASKSVSRKKRSFDPLCPYACPCGWMPPEDGVGSKRRIREVANKHWKQCQGCDAPAPTSQYRASKKKKASAIALNVATAKATQRFRELLASTRAKKPRIANAICDPDLDSPAGREGNPSVLYPCRRCHRSLCLSQYKLLPCPAHTGPKVSQLAFVGAFYGRKKAKKWQTLKKASPSQSAEANRKRWHTVRKHKYAKCKQE